MQKLKVEACIAPDEASLWYLEDDAVWNRDIALDLGHQAVAARG
jgi:hypothetical protein